MIIGKHKTISGVGFTASQGLTFTKKPTELNSCVGREMRDKKFPNRPAVQHALVNAMHTCGANLTPETKKKYGITTKKPPAK